MQIYINRVTIYVPHIVLDIYITIMHWNIDAWLINDDEKSSKNDLNNNFVVIEIITLYFLQ